MVPAHAGVGLQLLAVVVVQVRAQRLAGVQSAAVPPAGVLVLVVGVAHQHEAGLVGEAATHGTRGIAVLRATGQVEVGHVAPVHAPLDGEVEHGLLVAVLDASDAGLVTLLLVELHVLDDAHGQVLQRRLDVAEHELLAVEQNLRHRLAVESNIAVVVDIGTRHALDELLNGRALGRADGLGIIDERVLAHHHLGGTARDHRLLQHHALGLHQQVAQFLVLVAAQRHLAHQRLEAHRRNLQAEGAARRSFNREVSPLVGHRTAHERAVVGPEQLDGGMGHRLFHLGIHQMAADGQRALLLSSGEEGKQREEKKEQVAHQFRFYVN